MVSMVALHVKKRVLSLSKEKAMYVAIHSKIHLLH